MAKEMEGREKREELSLMIWKNQIQKINFLSRKDLSAIFQMRTGHSKLNFYLNRFDPIHPPHCRNCTHPYETTEHVLFECLGLKKDREKLLPPLPTIGNSLYGSASQLRNTAKLYYMSLSSKSWLTQKCLLVIIIIIIIIEIILFANFHCKSQKIMDTRIGFRQICEN